MRNSQKSWWFVEAQNWTPHILGGRVDFGTMCVPMFVLFLAIRFHPFVVLLFRLADGFTTVRFMNLNCFMDEPVRFSQAT